MFKFQWIMDLHFETVVRQIIFLRFAYKHYAFVKNI